MVISLKKDELEFLWNEVGMLVENADIREQEGDVSMIETDLVLVLCMKNYVLRETQNKKNLAEKLIVSVFLIHFVDETSQNGIDLEISSFVLLLITNNLI